MRQLRAKKKEREAAKKEREAAKKAAEQKTSPKVPAPMEEKQKQIVMVPPGTTSYYSSITMTFYSSLSVKSNKKMLAKIPLLYLTTVVATGRRKK